MRLSPAVPLLLLFATLATAAEPASPIVRRVDFDTTVTPITAQRIVVAIDDAERDGDEAVLIVLDTPGGLVSSMETIVKRMLAAKVPVIVWVGPSGAKAASAGFFILLAGDVAAMAPGTRAGASSTVIMGGENTDDNVMLRKSNEDLAALLRSIAERRGRNPEVSQRAVFEAKSYEETVALEDGLIDLIAPDVDTLLGDLDGREVTRFDGTKVTLHTAGAVMTTTEFGLRHRFLEVLGNPGVVLLLLMLGLAGLWIEATHPGLIFPGVAGALCLLLFVLSAQILPVSAAGVLLILLAIVMFILEIKVVSYGLLTFGGLVCLVIGGLMLVNGPIPALRVPLITVLPVALAFTAFVAIVIRYVVRAQRDRVGTGVEGLMRELGTVTVPLAPEGKVRVHGEIWNATATGAGPVPAGTRVRVVRVDDMLLTVEPLATGETADATRS